MVNDVIQLLGIANPQLSLSWTNLGTTTPTTLPSVSADGFTLRCTDTDEWLTPCTGIVTENQHQQLLRLPDGNAPNAASIVLQLAPQVYLALSRLYATLLKENPNNTPLPDRPVPRYFLYTNITKIQWPDNNGTNHTGPLPGIYTPGLQLHLRGDLTIHDEEGIVIDPVAVAAALNHFWQTHSTLESKSPSATTSTSVTNAQLHNLAQTGGNQKRLYITDLFNSFADPGTNLTNLTAVAGTHQFIIIDRTSPITKQVNTDTMLQLALSPNGLFGDSVNYPGSIATLPRDYVRLKMVNWNNHLLGDIPTEEPTHQQNVLPVVRINEQIGFCLTGNECLGELNRVLTTAPDEQLLVSVSLSTDFTLPPPPDGSGNHLWPAFSQDIAGNTAVIPSSLEEGLNRTAHFITDPTVNNTDVYLELTSQGLQNGWAVRVFTRLFHADGRETRGDGAGTIVRDNIAAFRLKDPLRVNQLYGPVNAGLLTNALLMVDMVVINSATPIQSRRFGNLVTPIASAADLTPEEQNRLLVGSNTFDLVANRAVSPGGFFGVRTSTKPISEIITDTSSYLLASGSDTQPRQAPVLPTQSRLEGLIAGATGSVWSALSSGIRLTRESRENRIILGNPGSPGGTDTHTTGVTTSGGRLAYDLARAALRRAQNVSVRLNRLINNNHYTLPAVPAATGHTFVGAVLQNIAKKTESPRFAEHQQNMTNLPADASALSTQIQQLLTSDTRPNWLPEAMKDQLKSALTGTVAAADCTLALSELRREYAASLFGRRDTFYALKKAIESAQQFIYIETTLFGPTSYSTAPATNPPANDLIEILKQQLIDRPGLKLILCLAEEVSLNRGYENIARFHINNRSTALLRLLGTQDSTTHHYEHQNQVVAFHPLAFPGRPLKINTQCIIVDDVWALSGSSSFSQRGLYFDGSTDVVFCDRQLRGGKSLALLNFRRNLMRQYIRTDKSQLNMADANAVFLQDGRSAFQLMRMLTENGGSGMVKPFVPANPIILSPTEQLALNNLADPNGDSFFTDQALLNTWLAALSSVPE